MGLTCGIGPPEPLGPVARIIFLFYKRGAAEIKIKISVPPCCFSSLFIPWIPEMSSMNNQFGMPGCNIGNK